jgi:hypothetical protein
MDGSNRSPGSTVLRSSADMPPVAIPDDSIFLRSGGLETRLNTGNAT